MNGNCKGLILVLAALLLVSIVVCVCFSNAKGENYTDDYKIFGEVNTMTSTIELLEYCHANGIEYSINNGIFEMEKYDIAFALDKNECTLVPNKHMYNMSLLSKEHYGLVSIITERKEDGSLVKTLSLKTLTHRYELSDGTYRLITAWPAYLSFLFVVAFAVVLFAYIKYCLAYKRHIANTHITG